MLLPVTFKTLKKRKTWALTQDNRQKMQFIFWNQKTQFLLIHVAMGFYSPPLCLERGRNLRDRYIKTWADALVDTTTGVWLNLLLKKKKNFYVYIK